VQINQEKHTISRDTRQLAATDAENEQRGRDSSGSCQIISGAGIWPLTNCRMPSDLENSIAHLYENGRARRERKTSRVTFCRSSLSSARLRPAREETINFSTGRSKNSPSRFPAVRLTTLVPRISITSPKNRAVAYPFLFPRRSMYPATI